MQCAHMYVSSAELQPATVNMEGTATIVPTHHTVCVLLATPENTVRWMTVSYFTTARSVCVS